MKPKRIPTERLQAQLNHANQMAILEDIAHRADIRQELQEQNRLNILRSWAGDFIEDQNGL
jgi:hypothetical protein